MGNNILLDELRKLPPSSTNSFEHLITKLMEGLTGRKFYLANAGSQDGRDISSDRLSGNVIAVECKRYQNDTKLNKRELLGELAEVSHDIPDLDIWVLVASKIIPSQLIEDIRKEANSKGIEFFPISSSSEEGNPSELEVLCAYGKDITIDFIQKNNPDIYFDKLTESINAILACNDFRNKFQRLKDFLLSDTIGFDNWRQDQNNWFLERCNSEKESRSSFKQLLNVSDTKTHLIERTILWNDLDNWFQSWSENHPFCLLQGDEGDGKTWVAASWLLQKINSDPNFPAVIFMSSASVSSPDVYSLLTEAISRLARKSDQEFHSSRLKRWLKRPNSDRPLLVLILDGINERFSHEWWRELLESLSASPFECQIGVIITCRSIYWKQYFDVLKNIHITSISIPGFNDSELAQALKQYNLTISDIPQSIIPLLKKPRYFDLTIRLRDEMAGSGDITPARLIFEDWKDRYQRKTQLALDPESFQNLIIDLAEKHQKGIVSFRQQEVSETIQTQEKIQSILQELITGGILIRKNNNQLCVDKNRLQYGLGLLLANSIYESCQSSTEKIDDLIAQWLEAQPEDETKSSILGYAVLQALNDKNFPEIGLLFLLKWWVSAQNPSMEFEESFIAYFPINPSIYFLLVETIVDSETHIFGIKELLITTFSKWEVAARSKLIGVFEKWLGYICQNDILNNGEIFEGKSEEEINLNHIEKKTLAVGYPLMIVDNPQKYQLSKIALAVISQSPREPYIHAITLACFSDIVRNFPQNLDSCRWILNSSKTTLTLHIIKEAEKLICTKHENCLEAAKILLHIEGSKDALIFLEMLLPFIESNENTDISWPLINTEDCHNHINVQALKKELKDLCYNPISKISNQWVDDINSFAENFNPEQLWTQQLITEAQYYFDEMEPVLCAYTPRKIGPLINKAIQKAHLRNQTGLYQLIFNIGKYFPLIDSQERNQLTKIWHDIQNPVNNPTEENKIPERILFSIILQNESEGNKQLQFLQKRLSHYQYPPFLELFFRPITDWDYVLHLLNNYPDPKTFEKVLWFISAKNGPYPPEIIHIAQNLLNHHESLIRFFALRILIQSADQDAIDSFINSEWSCDNENHQHEEDEVGIQILCKFGKNLTYEDLIRRIEPDKILYAISQRGFIPDEVRLYSCDLYRQLNISDHEGPEWNSSLFTHSPNDGFELVMDQQPEIFRAILDEVLQESKNNLRKLRYYRGFYLALLSVLIKRQPDLGIELYKKIYRYPYTGDIWILLNILFSGPEEKLASIWDEFLNNCTTDLDLLKLMIASIKGNGKHWLLSKTCDEAKSSIAFFKARSITMLGFFDDNEETVEIIQKELENTNQSSWMHRVIEKALESWNKNHWAKHWFRRFLQEKDDVISWSSFRLFLHCVDKRFELWGQQETETLDPDSPRSIFFYSQYEEIQKHIKENEKALQEHFIGQKVLKHRVWPWI